MTHCFRLSITAVLGFALAGALSACTDNHYNYYYPGTGDGGVANGNEVSATIGQEGGSLRVTDPSNPAFGAGVDVPPGSVAQNTTIGISPEATVDTPVASGAGAGSTARSQAGPVISITPGELKFTGQKVRISVPAPVDPSTGMLTLMQFKSGTWTPVAGSGAAGGGVVTGDVDSLGLFVAAILGGGPPPADTTPPTFAGVGEIISGPGVGQVTLSWLPASDEVTPTADIVYEVWQSVVDPDPTSTPVAITDSGALSIILSAAPGVSLRYLVRARDLVGNVDTNLNIKTSVGN